MRIDFYNAIDIVSTLEKMEIVDFIHKNLNGYYDTWPSVQNAVEYALNPNPAFGGLIICARENKDMIGALVMNKTNMSGCLPENHMVYLAVDKQHDKDGIDKILIEKALSISRGQISIHLNPKDPRKKVFEDYGFNNIYVEMRYNNE